MCPWKLQVSLHRHCLLTILAGESCLSLSKTLHHSLCKLCLNDVRNVVSALPVGLFLQKSLDAVGTY